MASLHVLLGPETLLETDATALPALRSLCQALNIRMAFDEKLQMVTLESSLADQGLAILTTSDGSPAWQAVAEQISIFLSERLTRAGIRASIVKSAADLKGNSLILRVDLGNLPTPGVVVTHGWRYWRNGRRLTALIAQQVGQHSGLPNLGTRVSVGGDKWAGLPVITVALGMPESSLAQLAEQAPFYQAIATGIYSGIACHQAEPLLRRVQEALQPFGFRSISYARTVAPEEALEATPAAVPDVEPDYYLIEEEGMKTINDVDSKAPEEPPVPESAPEPPEPEDPEGVARVASIPTILRPSRMAPPKDLRPVPNLTPVVDLDLRPAPPPEPRVAHAEEPIPVKEQASAPESAPAIEESAQAADVPPPALEPENLPVLHRPVRRHLLGPCQVPGDSSHVYLFRRHASLSAPLPEPVESAPEPLCADETATELPQPTFAPPVAPERPLKKRKPPTARSKPQIIQSSDSVIRFP